MTGPRPDLALLATEPARRLAEPLARALAVPLGEVGIQRFANENLACRPPEPDAATAQLCLVHCFAPPVSERILELLFALRALCARAPRRLTAVLPYLAYSRSDCAEHPGEPVPARLLAEAIELAGAQRIVSFDLHSPQLAGFYRVPLVELSARPLLAGEVRGWQLPDPVVVSPDLGGAKRASRFAAELGWPLALIAKQRSAAGVAAHELHGDVRGRSVVLFDDEIASGGTLLAATERVLAHGARSVRAVATHAVLTAGALERLERSPLERILLTDTCPGTHPSPKLQIASVAPALAEYLRRS